MINSWKKVQFLPCFTYTYNLYMRKEMKKETPNISRIHVYLLPRFVKDFLNKLHFTVN